MRASRAIPAPQRPSSINACRAAARGRAGHHRQPCDRHRGRGFFGFSRAQAAGRIGDQDDRVAEITGKVAGARIPPCQSARRSRARPSAAHPAADAARPTPTPTPTPDAHPDPNSQLPRRRRYLHPRRRLLRAAALPALVSFKLKFVHQEERKDSDGRVRPQEGGQAHSRAARVHGADARTSCRTKASTSSRSISTIRSSGCSRRDRHAGGFRQDRAVLDRRGDRLRRPGGCRRTIAMASSG